MSIINKLSAKEGSILQGIQADIAPEVIENIMPIAEKFIDPLLGEIKKELGNDENIVVLRNIDGQLIISVLKSNETDIDIKNENTILKSFDISEMATLIKHMNLSGNKEV